MKIAANSQYMSLLEAGQRQWIIGHLFTFESASGALDYFTDMDTDISYGGNTFKSGGLRIDGIKTRIGIGVSVDEQEVIIWASPTDTLFGAAALTGLAEGLMDGGTVARDRIVWLPQTGDVSLDIQSPPQAVWRTFLGYMSTIERLGRASVTFKVKSPLVKLNIDMPRNFYQPGCLWSLFDSGCTLDRDNFAFHGSCALSDTRNIRVNGGIPTPAGADGLANYQRGRILFTSGVNNGVMTTIDGNDNNFLYLAYRLNAAPGIGDTFTAYPGCSKSFNTCQLKFNNTNNFRGFDKVPPVFVAV